MNPDLLTLLLLVSFAVGVLVGVVACKWKQRRAKPDDSPVQSPRQHRLRKPANAEELLQLIVESGLLSEGEVQKFKHQFTSEQWAELAVAVNIFAHGLVQNELLTQWQADLLLQGKHKGFFLGKYKLLQHLGSGDFSSVYLAEHLSFKHCVALKVLPRSSVDRPDRMRRFMNLARYIARINSPHVVRAHDINHEGNTHYIVMDYVPGQTL